MTGRQHWRGRFGLGGCVAIAWLLGRPAAISWLGATLRGILIWVAFIIAFDALAESSTPRRSVAKILAYLVTVLALAVALTGSEAVPDCDPDPLYGGCSTWSWPTSQVAMDRFLFILAYAGIPVLLGCAGGYALRRRRGLSMDPRSDLSTSLVWIWLRTHVPPALSSALLLLLALAPSVWIAARFGAVWGLLSFGIGTPLVMFAGMAAWLRVIAVWGGRQERSGSP